MDSTLINIECIDEVADAAGRKAEVAAITEAAMRGDISLTTKTACATCRIAAKACLQAALTEVYEHKLALNPGAQQLVIWPANKQV